MGLCGSKSDVETSQSPIEAPVVVQASTEDKPSVADVVEPSVVAAAVPKKLAFQGMLQKKRPGGRGGFQARYCVLDEKALFSYYASVSYLTIFLFYLADVFFIYISSFNRRKISKLTRKQMAALVLKS